VTAILLALVASAAWGTSDFLGGVKAKTVPLTTVLFVSQGVGLLAVVILLALLDRPLPSDERLLLSLAAGAAVVTGLGLLYLALARGPVIVVAPVAAAGATIPVVVGLVGGDPVSAPIAAGLACALLGSLAAAYEPSGDEPSDRMAAGALLGMGAAIAIGVFLTLFDAASEADPYWATGGTHVAGSLTALAFLAVSRPRSATLGASSREALLALAAIGICSVVADGAFATASREGDLSVVSVLSSLYPVVTVLLATTLLRERVCGPQLVGVVLAFTGIALLAAEAG
jgi:drug/metabolite transporter (DMT)-like permease